ncbi:MAG TPA: T9SS type A sorting domain-containing protein [Bacteroidia bacterium]|nr:T9SS type A sorting domain-containing protein [Bacteroidia bacterium]
MKKTYKVGYVLIVMIGVLQVSFAQQIAYQKIFNGVNPGYGYSAKQTSDTGYIITGSAIGIGAGNADVYLIKTDAKGDTLWTKTIGGANTEFGISLQQTTDGGYIISGKTNGFGAGNYDVYLVKADSYGNALWTKSFGGIYEDEGTAVLQTSDGGYVIAGRTASFGSGNLDVYLLRTDGNGDTLWTKTLGGIGNSNDYAEFIQQTSDGGYIITGGTNAFGAGSWDAYLIKTDSSGNLSWAKTYGGADVDDGFSVQQTFDGGYILAGGTDSYGAGNRDIYLIKTDSNGDTLWTRTYGGNDFEEANAVQQTADSGYIITGRTLTFGAGNADVYLVKTNSSGDTLWTKTFGGIYDDVPASIQQTIDGGYIISGGKNSTGTGNHIYLIKTDSNGNSGCNQGNPATIVSGTSTQITNPAIIVSSTATIVTSPATIVGSGSTVTTLCTTVGIYDLEFIPNNQDQFSPNPLTTQSKLTFKNPNKEKLLFTLYDITGRITESVSTTNNEIILTKGSKQPGVYLYNLMNEKKGEKWNGKIVISN